MRGEKNVNVSGGSHRVYGGNRAGYEALCLS